MNGGIVPQSNALCQIGLRLRSPVDAADLHTGIVVPQDLPGGFPLLGQGVGAVLAHAHSVAVAGDIKRHILPVALRRDAGACLLYTSRCV